MNTNCYAKSVYDKFITMSIVMQLSDHVISEVITLMMGWKQYHNNMSILNRSFHVMHMHNISFILQYGPRNNLPVSILYLKYTHIFV